MKELSLGLAARSMEFEMFFLQRSIRILGVRLRSLPRGSFWSRAISFFGSM